MTTKIVLAPAGGGKTQAAVARVRAAQARAPLSRIWLVVADRKQENALKLRLSAFGTLGVAVGTFRDLYVEILGGAGDPYPITPEAVIRKVVRAAIDEAADSGALAKYLPIRQMPGLVTVFADLFAELKRARIVPETLANEASRLGRDVEELAAVYTIYQKLLQWLEWSDHEGLGWLAVRAVERQPNSIGLELLIVDGFDSFNPSQVALLQALGRQVETCITLTGDLSMSRPAHRRFARTLSLLQDNLDIEIEALSGQSNRAGCLAHLEANLFESAARRLPAEASIAFVEAQNMALEAREALRWVKARIVRDGIRPGDCAILARDIAAYRSALRQAAREFGLPFRIDCGEPLAVNPAVAAVLSLLQLPLVGWAPRQLVAALRSPYFDLSLFGLSPSDAAACDEIARAGQVVEGVEQWREACLLVGGRLTIVEDRGEEDERSPDLHATTELWNHLASLLQRLTPPPRAHLREYVRWVEDLLSPRGVSLERCVSSQPDTARRDEMAIDSLQRNVLTALRLGETLLAQDVLTYEQFLTELRQLVDGSTYRLEDTTESAEGSVLAASVETARGVAFRAVAVLGLSEGLFPSHIVEDGLLSDQQRHALIDRGLPLEPRLRSDQQTLFYEAVTRAGEWLLLTRPYLAEDGEAWEASPFWSAALSLFETDVRHVRQDDRQPDAEAASAVELLLWSANKRSLPGRFGALAESWEIVRHCGRVLEARIGGAPKGEFEGEVPAICERLRERYSPQHVWSPTRLETYAACPFHFYVGQALALAERQYPELGFDAAQLGSMLHEVLERVYLRARDNLSLDNLLATLPGVARAVFDAAPRQHGFRPSPLWDASRSELLEILSNTLTGLAEVGEGFRPARFEQRFGRAEEGPLVVEVGGDSILFGGIIDRVDIDQDGNLRVIDYKTGASHLHANDLRAGRRIQLAIYAAAAERCLKLGRASDGFYWAIRANEISNLRLRGFYYETDGRTYEGVSGAVRLAFDHAARLVQAIRAGTFTPKPPDGCLRYCSGRLFCWRYKEPAW